MERREELHIHLGKLDNSPAPFYYSHLIAKLFPSLLSIPTSLILSLHYLFPDVFAFFCFSLCFSLPPFVICLSSSYVFNSASIPQRPLFLVVYSIWNSFNVCYIGQILDKDKQIEHTTVEVKKKINEGKLYNQNFRNARENL